jgi:hypothetical protein
VGAPFLRVLRRAGVGNAGAKWGVQGVPPANTACSVTTFVVMMLTLWNRSFRWATHIHEVHGKICKQVGFLKLPVEVALSLNPDKSGEL